MRNRKQGSEFNEDKERFRKMIEESGLSSPDIAVLLGRDVSVFAVNSWRAPTGNAVPFHIMELLTHKLDDQAIEG